MAAWIVSLSAPLDRHRDSTSAALAHAKNRRLADRPASGLEFLGLVLVRLFPANIGFVDFDDALQHFELRSARLAQPMKDEPSRLLRDPDFLGELHGGNALARRHKQIHRVNPLVQRNMRPLENRSGANREVLLALVAAIEAVLARRDPLAKAANRATRAIRPKTRFKIDARRLLVGEHLEKLEGRNRALGHRATPRLRSEYGKKSEGVKYIIPFQSSPTATGRQRHRASSSGARASGNAKFAVTPQFVSSAIFARKAS